MTAMTGYVIRRCLGMIPLLWGFATITFFLMHLVPGGPFDREKELPEATKANLERKYNLDEPLPKQYALYLWNLAQGDLRTLFTRHREVRDIIEEGFPVSAQLGLTAFTFAIPPGLSL